MTLELPPKIPETLTGHPPRDKDAYYQVQLVRGQGEADEEIALVLLKGPAVVATASKKVVYELNPATVISTVTELKNQILDHVALAAEVCKALPDIEVRLVERGPS